MTGLHVVSLRGKVTETRHEVAVAVVDGAGKLLASNGDPDLVTPMRSAAKPFQALPLVEDGAAERFEIGERELALACASHNSERYQVQIVQEWMTRMGLTEDQLVCGSHRPLAKELGFRREDGTWDEVDLAPLSRVASNCSGKHTGMLVLAKHRGWDSENYAIEGHPVQERCRSAIATLCGVPSSTLGAAGDGCGVVSWALPLRAMATGYARCARSSGAMRQVVAAITKHADLVAGKRRLCTALMRAYPGEMLAKVGAGGVYCAASIEAGLGIAIKAIDGDHRAAAVALVEVLHQLGLAAAPASRLPEFARPVILNTNGEVVGRYEPRGSITFTSSKSQ